MNLLKFFLIYFFAFIAAAATDARAADKPESFVSAVQLTGGFSLADPRFGTITSYDLQGPANSVTPLAVMEHPAVTQPRYAITGYVRYSGVSAPGYLELWNHFPGGGHYFSRTMAPTGEMGQISGNSDWRRFTLPFYTDGSPQKMVPERLAFNLYLPQGGKVSLAGVELHQFSTTQDPLAASSGGWWSIEAANRISSVFTPIIVVWWLAASFFAWRGTARTVVVGSIKTAAAAGAAILVIFVAALISKQPLHIIIPLGVCGAILAAPALVQLKKINSRYDEIDQRRMLARDARL